MENSESIIQKKIALDNYRMDVANAANKKSSVPFSNEGEDHAAIVLGKIFETSKENVRIYANDMDGTIGNKDDYYKALDLYLSSCASLKVIVDCKDKILQPYEESPMSIKIIKDWIKKGKKNIEFKEANGVFRKSVIENIKNPIDDKNGKMKISYFTLGDNEAYRIEYDNVSHKAECCFSDRNTVHSLSSLFDEHFSKLDPINVV